MKELETARLILRKFKEDDLAAVHSYASCAENLVYMTWGPNSEDQSRDFIKREMAKAQEDKEHNYAIILKENNSLIGGCGLSLDEDKAEIGWLLHRDHWGRGYCTELGRELLRLGFEELKLHRIVARCDSENIESYRVMEKIGMRREGLFIESRPPHKKSGRKYSDELRYAILAREWRI